jgi:pyruvate dehydrogenase E2 component (dihydrolipoamide acetyltransferase)
MTAMTDITMPQLSDAMEEGTIVKWLVEDGGEVVAGAELVEIETDKATMAYPSDAEGTLEIVVPEGESAPVGALIARIGTLVAAVVQGDAEHGPAQTVHADRIPAPREVAAPQRRSDAGFHGAAAGVATPVARRYAAVHGVALDEIRGTGPRGRITKNDVLETAGIVIAPVAPRPAAREARHPAAAPAAPVQTGSSVNGSTNGPGTTPATAAADGASRREPSRLQQVIARRMVESKSTVPHFQVETEVDMTEAVALRRRLKGLVPEGERVPSFNDLVVRACAVALRDHPLANGSWVDDEFELHERINVGIAVAVDDGLVVPTIFDTDKKSLGQIGGESRRLADRVREGTIAPNELAGGTFTVSNLGMFGMTAITPVVNPPQAAILGVGRTRETLARVDGEIVDRPLMTLTLSCDHRILYGADASRFLAQIRDLLEQPLRIAL